MSKRRNAMFLIYQKQKKTVWKSNGYCVCVAPMPAPDVHTPSVVSVLLRYDQGPSTAQGRAGSPDCRGDGVTVMV
jgi:hypothetical protein